MELANEYILLVCYGLCLTQTELVSDVEARRLMGWVLIVLISASFVLNVGYTVISSGRDSLRKLRLFYLRRKRDKKLRIARDELLKIDIYRKNILKIVGEDKSVVSAPSLREKDLSLRSVSDSSPEAQVSSRDPKVELKEHRII